MAKTFGRYELVRELGRGGQAIVYEARDTELRRTVALKVLLPGAWTEDGIRRFEREARAAAKLNHRNIVSIYDVGKVSGKHYLAMEFVDGEPLDKAIAERRPGAREAMSIMEQVADAAHYAHTQGVVHRDIKPANILIHSDGTPKLADFGLALDVKARTQLTQSGTIMGTPAYMSPEQAKGRSHKVDERGDVYSLGAVLYEMLTGRPPFRAETQLALLEKVAFEAPRHLTEIRRTIPADAEIVCLKCLEKERSRRYQTAAELADDCRRFLAGEPIAARPASMLYMAKKRVARHKAAAIAGLTALVAVIGLTVYYVITLHRALTEAKRGRDAALVAETQAKAEREKAVEAAEREREAKKKADAERERAVVAEKQAVDARDGLEFESYRYGIYEADRLASTGDTARAQALLGSLPERFRGWEYYHVLRKAKENTFSLHWNRCQQDAFCVAFSPDGTRLASGGKRWKDRKRLNVWDVATGRMVASPEGHIAAVKAVAFSPDGKWLASGGKDRTVRIWDAKEFAEIKKIDGLPRDVNALAFSPDSRRLAVGLYDATARLIDTENWNEVLKIKKRAGQVYALAFSPDGRLLALNGEFHVTVYDAETGKETRLFWAPNCSRAGVAFSPDGSRLAACWNGYRSAVVWDLESGRETVRLRGHESGLNAVAFSPDGGRICTAGGDHTVRVWDAVTGRQLVALRPHENWYSSVAFSPDGKLLAAGNVNNRVWVWKTHLSPGFVALKGHTETVNSIRFSPDGKRLATGSTDRTIRIWDIAAAKMVVKMTGGSRGHGVGCVAFSPDGKRLASAYRVQRALNVWDAEKGKLLASLKGHEGFVDIVAFTSDGKTVISGDRKRIVKRWGAETGRELKTLKCNGRLRAIAPGAKIGALSDGGTLRVVDLETGREFYSRDIGESRVSSMGFSPDGRLLASVGGNRTLKVFEVETGQELFTATAGAGGVSQIFGHVSFSPDGKRLAVSTSVGTVQIWDVERKRDVLTLDGLGAAVFSPDGRCLVTGAEDNTVRIWLTEGMPPDPGPDTWYVIAGFSNVDRRGFNATYPPERGIDLDAKYQIAGGAEASWKLVEAPGPTFDLLSVSRKDWIVHYAFTYLDSAADQEVTLVTNSAGGRKLWINGEPVAFQPVAGRESRTKVKLRKGLNPVLLKVVRESGRAYLHLRVEDNESAVRRTTVGPAKTKPRPVPAVGPQF